jgi:hypothetical protein
MNTAAYEDETTELKIDELDAAVGGFCALERQFMPYGIRSKPSRR